MIELAISILWRIFGQQGDPFGVMFWLADISATDQSQNKKAATMTAKLKNALRHVKIIQN